jgi:hypothetical protein
MVLAISGLVILGVQMLAKVEYIYIIQLSGVFGTAAPFASDDVKYVRAVVAAIRTALVDQGLEVGAQARVLAKS